MLRRLSTVSRFTAARQVCLAPRAVPVPAVAAVSRAALVPSSTAAGACVRLLSNVNGARVSKPGPGKVAKKSAAKELSTLLEDEARPETEDEGEMTEAPPVPAGWSMVSAGGDTTIALRKKLPNGAEVTVRFSTESVTESDNQEEIDDEQKEEKEDGYDEPVPEEEEDTPSITSQFQVVVATPNRGSMLFQCMADNGEIAIARMTPMDNALAADFSAEAELKRENVYAGPDLWEEMGDEVQATAVRFLEDVGVDENLVHYVVETAMYRQFKEFQEWSAKCSEFFKGF